MTVHAVAWLLALLSLYGGWSIVVRCWQGEAWWVVMYLVCLQVLFNIGQWRTWRHYLVGEPYKEPHP